jgi:hypothetical protein
VGQNSLYETELGTTDGTCAGRLQIFLPHLTVLAWNYIDAKADCVAAGSTGQGGYSEADLGYTGLEHIFECN